MKTKIAVVAFVSLLSACASSYTYVKEEANNELLQEDLKACKSVMARLHGDDAKEAMDKCMADKGYDKRIDKLRL